MKKIISRSFIAMLLAFVLIFNPISSIKTAYAAVTAGAVFSAVGTAVGIVSGAITILTQASASSDELAKQRQALRSSWVDIPSNSQYLIRVSGDDLTSAVMSLVGAGVPCKIVYNSSIDGYVIQCTSNPLNSNTGFLLDSSYTYSGKYFGYCTNHYDTSHSALYTYVFYATTLDSGSLLDEIHISLSAIHTVLLNMITPIEQTASRMQTLLGYVDGIEGYIDGVEGYLDNTYSTIVSSNSHIISADNKLTSLVTGINNTTQSLSDIVDLISNTQYVSGSLTDSNGTSYPTVTLPYEVATALCAYLNSSYVGRSVYRLTRDVSGSPEETVTGVVQFMYANIVNNYIRIDCRTSSTQVSNYLCSKRHTLFKVAAPNTINLSGNVNATLDDTDIVNALDEINTTLNGLSLSSDPLIQYCSRYTQYSDGTPYSSVTIPYEVATQLVAILNSDLSGKYITALSQDDGGSNSSVLFRDCYMSDGFIRVVRGDTYLNTSYLLTSNRVLIKYSDPTYLSKLDGISSALQDMLDLSYDPVNNINYDKDTNIKITAIAGGVANIEASLDDLIGSISIDDINLNIDDINVNLNTISDLLDLGFDDVVDGLNALPSSTDLIPYVDQLETYTDGLEGLLSNIEEDFDDGNLLLNQILTTLDNTDLVNSQTIQTLVTNWSGDVQTALYSSNRLVSLFDAAYGDSALSFAIHDWVASEWYFTHFFD